MLDILITLILIVVALKLFFALLPRWLLWTMIAVVVMQVLDPRAVKQTVGAVAASSLLEPLLTLGFLLLGVWVLLAKGLGIRKKR